MSILCPRTSLSMNVFPSDVSSSNRHSSLPVSSVRHCGKAEPIVDRRRVRCPLTNQPMITTAEAERIGRIANLLIDAALANRDIQAHLADHRPPKLWTIAGVHRNPTGRVEREHAVVIGGIGESLAAARHKCWGEFIGVLSLEPGDPVHCCRILYIYKASSP